MYTPAATYLRGAGFALGELGNMTAWAILVCVCVCVRVCVCVCMCVCECSQGQWPCCWGRVKTKLHYCRNVEWHAWCFKPLHVGKQFQMLETPVQQGQLLLPSNYLPTWVPRGSHLRFDSWIWSQRQPGAIMCLPGGLTQRADCAYCYGLASLNRDKCPSSKTTDSLLHEVSGSSMC